MRRRQRGFTLMEVMISMALAGIVTASVLALVRTQLSAFEMNDQIMRTQQNTRAAMDFLESNVRRACGGMSQGWVAVNVPGVTQQAVPCFRWYDGANIPSSGGSNFTTGTAGTTADALEVVYATGTMASLTAVPTLNTTPSVALDDISQFAVNDFILVGDYSNAYLFKVATKSSTSTTRPTPGTLGLGTLSANVVGPTGTTITLAIGSPVFKAQTYSFFVAPASSTSIYNNMLMVDPNGVASTNHSSSAWGVSTSTTTGPQPAIENVVDFQVEIANDNDQDGIIQTAEWIGDASGETLGNPPWFTTGNAYPKQVRISIVTQTSQSYSGATTLASTTTTPGYFGDRTSYASTATTTAAYNPRYRASRMIVAPRAWNLTE